MYVKIYTAVWLAVAIAAALFFVTGNMTPVVVVAFGFLAFGLTFMGMMSVLPSTVGHHAPAQKPVKIGANRLETMVGSTSDAIRKIGADIAASGTVEVRKPKYP